MDQSSRRRDYTIFVDESGTFEDTGGASCVVGIVVEAPLRALPSRNLGDALKNDVPWLPWPLHAHLYNLGAYHLIAWMRASGKQRLAFPHCARIERLAALVASSVDETPREARKLVARLNAVVPYEVAWSLQRWIEQQAPDDALALRSCVDLVEDRIRKRLGALAEMTSAFVVAAAAAPSAEWQGAAADPYLSALSAMLDRLASLIADEASEVWPVIGIRDVSLGGTRRGLDAATVGKLWSDAIQGVAPGRRPPTMWPARPSRYDEHVHAGLVLADFAANRMRVPLSARRTGWAALRGVLTSSVVLPTSLPLDGVDLPSVAADGAARRAVTLARSYDTAQPAARPPPWSRELDGCSRAWAREQAEAWTAFLSNASKVITP